MAVAQVTTQELLAKYKEDCHLRDMTYESIRSYVSALRIFVRFLEENDYNVLKMDNDVLEDFLLYLRDTRGNSQSRIENYFSALSSFYDFLSYKSLINNNLILPFRKRYLKRYKKNGTAQVRKLISVEEMSYFVNSIISLKDRTIAVLFAKTGIRRGELVEIEVDDVDLENMSIVLKPFHKRSNCLVFFDEETKNLLKRWLIQRERLVQDGVTALFVSDYGEKLKRCGVYNSIVYWSEKLGFHDPKSRKLQDRFSCHNFRHWNTTHLLRNGMPREYVKQLRGDTRGEAIDIYHHIDESDLKKAYLACIPQLGVV